jgi:hypothetical protein
MRSARKENMELKICSQLKIGDYLLSPILLPHKTVKSWSSDQLRFVGMIMTDGHLLDKGNAIRVSVKKDKEWFKQVFKDGLQSFGYVSCYKESLNKRGDLNLWCNSKELKELLIKSFGISKGKKANSIDINDEIIYSDLESIKAFIDSVFCCDGWVSNQQICFSNTSFNFVQKLQLLLKKFSIHSSYIERKPSSKNPMHHLQYQLRIEGSDIEKFRKQIELTMKRKQDKIINLKPKKFERNVVYNEKEYRLVKIRKIEETEGTTVYDFSVLPNLHFIANGILTHNCHFLPADSFSKLATVKTKYRFGLSATPYREDGRTNYIMALTGFPVGLDWRTIMNVLGKEYHTINVHIVKDLESKYQLIKQLYNPERRTIIFINLLDIGRKISEMLEIPMISGETKNRLEMIKKSKSFVASRVLELGVSIKDLEHIIEADFLFGSRREEVQRTGRLMHSIVKGKVHDIIMTKDELEQYGKRLYGLYEKGFRYKLIPHMTGITIERIKERKKIPTTAKNYSAIVNKLYQEGYFVVERTVNDVCNDAQKRGISITLPVRKAIFGKLDGMVRSGKLFKIKMEKGYKFKQR